MLPESLSKKGITAGFLVSNIAAAEDYAVCRAWKLEYGTQQTLAHQDAAGNWVLNDPPPDKALELLKCQRYQISLNPKGYGARTVGFGIANSESVCYVFCPIPVLLRANPSINVSGAWRLVSPSVVVNNIEVNNVSGNVVKLKVTASGLTIGKAYALESADDSSNIILDANL